MSLHELQHKPVDDSTGGQGLSGEARWTDSPTDFYEEFLKILGLGLCKLWTDRLCTECRAFAWTKCHCNEGSSQPPQGAVESHSRVVSARSFLVAFEQHLIVAVLLNFFPFELHST